MKKKTKSTPSGKILPSKNKAELKIVKRMGHTEMYDERKVYGSCYFACRNAHLSEIESEIISEKVTAGVTRFVKSKKNISSDEIFRALIEELNKYNQDAAFLYETHRDIS